MQEKSQKNENAGRFGEEMATKYLKDHNFKIMERNYRTKRGEIDIIAFRNGTLYFFEVKTRGVGSLIDPLEAVTMTKIERIKRAANFYLMENQKYQSLPCSFAVIGISCDAGKTNIECVLDAFE